MGTKLKIVSRLFNPPYLVNHTDPFTRAGTNGVTPPCTTRRINVRGWSPVANIARGMNRVPPTEDWNRRVAVLPRLRRSSAVDACNVVSSICPPERRSSTWATTTDPHYRASAPSAPPHARTISPRLCLSPAPSARVCSTFASPRNQQQRGRRTPPISPAQAPATCRRVFAEKDHRVETRAELGQLRSSSSSRPPSPPPRSLHRHPSPYSPVPRPYRRYHWG